MPNCGTSRAGVTRSTCSTRSYGRRLEMAIDEKLASHVKAALADATKPKRKRSKA